MQVEIWSDVVCPWCYIGKRHFEEALRGFEHADEVDTVWRSYELDPTAEARTDIDLIGRLATKYGVSREQAMAMNRRVSDAATAAGLNYHLDQARPGNTLDAHRIIHFAQAHDHQDAMKERLMRGYFIEGAPIADRPTLASMAGDIGLDEAEAAAMLETDRYIEAVRHDQARASELGITGVPFFVIGGRYGVSGAQPASALLEVLDRAWSEQRPMALVPGAETGDACGPDGCPIP